MVGEEGAFEGTGLTVLVTVGVHQYNDVAAPTIVLAILFAVQKAHEVILLKL